MELDSPKEGLLCAACKNLFNGQTGSASRSQKHHESVSSLYRGRDLGCRVCMLMWGRTSEKQRQYMRDHEGDAFDLSKSHHYWGHMTRDDVYNHYHVIIELFKTSLEIESIRFDLGLELVESK